MSFRFLSVIALCAFGYPALAQDALRVCADPNNLPFSNQQQQGFENKLAELMAVSLNRRVEYTWWSQRKGFAKQSLDGGACDVVMGVPSAMPGVLTTVAYYRSAYVFVSRTDRNLHITSLNDPRLSDLRIGIHVVGDDYAPPAYALAHRGITRNIVGFSLFGEYAEPSPARKLIDGVERGDVDVALVWGPIAGYFAQSATVPLEINPVTPLTFLGVPFAYDISAAVRSDNRALKTELDHVLASQSEAVQRLLVDYSVPQVP